MSKLKTITFQFQMKLIFWYINSRQFGKLQPTLVILISHNKLTRCNLVELFKSSIEMVVQKQSLPSFASIISVLSIVFYCVGFLRVELEMNEQKERISALENVAEAKPLVDDADIKIIKNAMRPGKLMLVFRKIQATSSLYFHNHKLVLKKCITGGKSKQLTKEYRICLAFACSSCFLCAVANKLEVSRSSSFQLKYNVDNLRRK